MGVLETIVPLAVRMLDNAIDVSNFPLEAQADEARAKRRIGLGVTGLADALMMCGARYGGKEAVALTEAWMKAIQRAAYLASAELAAEKKAPSRSTTRRNTWPVKPSRRSTRMCARPLPSTACAMRC